MLRERSKEIDLAGPGDLDRMANSSRPISDAFVDLAIYEDGEPQSIVKTATTEQAKTRLDQAA